MIHDVDEAIRTLIRDEALGGTQVDVVFDAPTKEWSARRNSPALDVYLYDIREDLRRREVGRIDVHDDAGRITGRRRPPRYFKLSYLVTAWTQRPEDEHRLLSAVLACFVRHEQLPEGVLQGSLVGTGLPIPVTVALPPPEDRALSDTWSALGGELKPSLDLVVTFPLDAEAFEPAAALVTEQPRLTVGRPDGTVEQANGHGAGPGLGRRGSAGQEGRPGPADDVAGQPPAGARARKGGKAPAGHDTTGEAATPGTAARSTTAPNTAAPDTAAPDPSGHNPSAADPAPADTVTGGRVGGPGRVYHWRTISEG